MKSTVIITTVITIGVILGAMRVWMGFTFPPEDFQWLQAYKDAAHLFMGGLGVAWWIQRQTWQWVLFLLLSVLEVGVAVASRFGC